MARRYPIVSCPECGRQVKVSPGSERIYDHGTCPASGRRIDLYGTNPPGES